MDSCEQSDVYCGELKQKNDTAKTKQGKNKRVAATLRSLIVNSFVTEKAERIISSENRNIKLLEILAQISGLISKKDKFKQ